MLDDQRPPTEMTVEPAKKGPTALPKMPSLRGSIHIEFKRCGRARCRCNNGQRHGPYLYRYFRLGGKLHKRYVRTADVDLAQAEVAIARALAVEAKAVKAKSDAAAQRSWDEYRRLASTLKQIMEETNGGE